MWNAWNQLWTTNINTHQLTEIELATWNPGFSVDLLGAEWRHLYNNSNRGSFNSQIPFSFYFIGDILFKHSIFHIYLNFLNIRWSCLHKATHIMLNNCPSCASNISYMNRCLPYKFLFSHSRSKQQTININPDARPFSFNSSTYQQTVPGRH